MPILITEGSQMKCSLGTKPSSIKVTSQSFKTIDNSLIATEADKAGMTNIPSFGNCRRSIFRPSCTPASTNWENTAQTQSLDGMKKLADDSFCMCSHGGKIEFTDTGSNSFVEIE